jgi:hypothetical protein
MGVGNVEVGIVSYSKAIIPVDPSRVYICDSLRCLKLCLEIYISLFEISATASALPIECNLHCLARSEITDLLQPKT